MFKFTEAPDTMKFLQLAAFEKKGPATFKGVPPVPVEGSKVAAL